MALSMVTGQLGTGKSYFAIRKGVEALQKGRQLITNFELHPDFCEKIAYRRPLRYRKRVSKRLDERALRYMDNYLYVPELADLMRVRLRHPRQGGCFVLLDECHRWMNAREWNAEQRKDILEWFALSRKRGFEVYVLTQHGDNVDAQVRRLCEDHIKLNNLRRSARFLGFRVIPFDLFIAVTVNAHYPKEVGRRDHYLLNWCKNLYDTMDTVSFSEHFEPEGGRSGSRTDRTARRMRRRTAAAPQATRCPPPLPMPARTGRTAERTLLTISIF